MSAQRYRRLQEWPSSHAPLIGEPDIQARIKIRTSILFISFEKHIHTPHQVIGFGHAMRSNRFVLNQYVISSKGSSSGLMLEKLEDAVRVPSFFCFLIMSSSIQVSIAERSGDGMGQNEIHIELMTHIF